MPSSSRKDKTPTSSSISKSSSKKDSSSGRTGARRLLKELETWRAEQPEERGIERLGPVSDESLMQWEAVINGRHVGHGYDGNNPPLIPQHLRQPPFEANPFCAQIGGRWLIAIEIPDEYPLKPPKMRFVTQVVHPNIALQNGEICLDLLKDAWTPTYSVLECVRAVRMLLSCPETDSPLNVDVAALLRGGDVVGTRRLVELWCSEDKGRYEGP
ncbi:ubiquitin-conjugating enzyme E2 4 [Beauveria brongniartii RCEF 3172]|uniref:Ubiquitin-conjugating enzyme E2 4 n=1 Tax=Beauveria brongniartii RCEF 3172 TaxID=1081107 RepID=A0A169YGD2_9HYPO|nr:ubiquitin-conjugating enzyme E2 4 [Beauveria brongniartii RCEF 3172]